MVVTVGIISINPLIIDTHYFHPIPLTAYVPFWSHDTNVFFSHMLTFSEERRH